MISYRKAQNERSAVYTSNGAYATSRHNQNDGNKFAGYMAGLLIIIIAVIVWAMFTVSPASASSLDSQYHVAGVFGDCRADYAVGDVYHKRDSYCVSSYHVNTTAHAVLDEVDTVSTNEQAKEARQEHDKQAIVTSDTVSIPDSVVPQEQADNRHGNNGHGNNVDHADISNPSGHTPHNIEDTSAPVDDEKPHGRP